MGHQYTGVVLIAILVALQLSAASNSQAFLRKIQGSQGRFNHAVEEGRVVIGGVLQHLTPKNWQRVERQGFASNVLGDSDGLGDEVVTFYVHLKQCGKAELKQLFEEITDPEHSSFQKYMTKEEIEELAKCESFAEDVERITSWLRSEGVADKEMIVGHAHIKVQTAVGNVESVFRTELSRFLHKELDNSMIRATGLLTIPESVQDRIEFVTGLTEFMHDFAALVPENEAGAAPVLFPFQNSLVTPQVLRKLYNVPRSLSYGSAENNSQGIAAFNDFYFADDLCIAHELLNHGLEDSSKPFTYPDVEYFGPETGADFGESDLDTQYITLMGPGVPTVFHNHAGGSWILGWALEAYNITTSNGPWVWSVSYGWPENAQCDQILNVSICSSLGHDWARYIEASDFELMKLGLLGASILVSSGDDGAPGFSIYCPPEPAFSSLSRNCTDFLLGADFKFCDCGSVVVDFSNGASKCILPQGLSWTGELLVDGAAGADCEFFKNEEKDPDLESIRKAVFDLLRSNSSSSKCDTLFDEKTGAFAATCKCEELPVKTGTVALSSGTVSFSISGYKYEKSYAPSMFFSDYPASSRYVLSVGATQLIPHYDGKCTSQGEILQDVEVASDFSLGAFDAGGGFSMNWPRPVWQEDAVSEYLSHSELLPPLDAFNSSNRAYPDLSFNGVNYVVVIQSRPNTIGGTSASAPALAGIISLMNGYLLKNGKPSLGFLPPLFYKAAKESRDTFNKINNTLVDLYGIKGLSIQTADNSCSRFGCCKYGFKGLNSPGLWDAVTGLGTPNVANLFKYILDLYGLEDPDVLETIDESTQAVSKEVEHGLSFSTTIAVSASTFLLGALIAVPITAFLAKRHNRAEYQPLYGRYE